MKKLSLNIWIARLIFCVCVILIYHLIGNFGVILNLFSKLFNVLTPIITGGVIAFLFFPICRKIELTLNKLNFSFVKKHVRLFAVLIVVIIILILMMLILYGIFKVVPLIYDGLINAVLNFSANFNQICNSYREKFKDVLPITQLIDSVNSYMSSETLIKWVSMLNYNSYVGKIASIIGYIFNFFIGLIISIYILLERATLKKTFIRILNLICNRHDALQIRHTITRINQILYAFIFGQIIDAFFVAYVMSLIFSLFKISNGLSLAAVYFLCALIPYFGSSIGVFLITLLSFVLGNDKQFIFVLIISVILQQIDGNLINPKIVGKAVGLGPFNVILGIIFFGGMLGFYGFFLGAPLMAICLELIDDFIKSWERKKQLNLKIKSLSQKLQ